MVDATKQLFKHEGPHDFLVQGPNFGYGSPLLNVVYLTLKWHQRGLEFEFPEGVDVDWLENVKGKEPLAGESTVITNSVGKKLAELGKQVLKLNGDKLIQPPLLSDRVRSIQRLIEVVDKTETLPWGETEFV